MKVRSMLGRIPALRIIRSAATSLANDFGFNLRWLRGLVRMYRFHRQYRAFRIINRGSPFALRGTEIVPCLGDCTPTTPIEPVYFLQDTWFAQKIADARPGRHVDVGSSAKTMALVAQFVPVTMVDIRPVDVEVERFSFLPGSALALPFGDASLSSVSSLCVIEHIGLGRYGDELDACGSEKAAAELRRVVTRGGDLYVSVPVDAECRIYFNAHRAFTRDYALALFRGMLLVEERYIYGRSVFASYEPQRGFGTGLYHFRKI